jgi:hypothetical protein
MKYIKIIITIIFIALITFNTYSVLRINAVQNAQSSIIGYLITADKDGVTGFTREVVNVLQLINKK